MMAEEDRLLSCSVFYEDNNGEGYQMQLERLYNSKGSTLTSDANK